MDYGDMMGFERDEKSREAVREKERHELDFKRLLQKLDEELITEDHLKSFLKVYRILPKRYRKGAYDTEWDLQKIIKGEY